MLAERGAGAEVSDLTGAIRLDSTVMPSEVPGFADGLCTIQSEGSVLAASLAGKFYRGGLILDMCSGRGVKAGQVLQSCPDARLEGWELSSGRHKSAGRKGKTERNGNNHHRGLRRGRDRLRRYADTQKKKGNRLYNRYRDHRRNSSLSRLVRSKARHGIFRRQG